jgi:hypothetical protein
VTHRSAVASHDSNACKCRWPLSEPRTEAGQQLLADFRDEEGDYLAPWQVRGMILAIEHEAGSLGSQHGFREGAAQVAIQREIGVAPDPLPPCPICGKDDLFIGTDGKPGCPHCEVAVVLPSPEPSE